MDPISAIIFVVVSLVAAFVLGYAAGYAILKPIVNFILAPLKDENE
ncbi:MAG: hypothetical protein ABEK50_14730 [bacterium]